MAEFNREMANAKENARTMPGGELLIEEQDEIIEMLEKLKKQVCRLPVPSILLFGPSTTAP